MGAISAFLGPAAANTTAVERSLAAAPHRGSSTTSIALGRCALAAASRPQRQSAWLASDGSSAAVVTGVLDDLADLAASLGLAAGADPAQVVLAAVKRDGPAAPARLRGLFAAAVWHRDELTLFRDQLGLKPLFYRDHPAGTIAASEAKQVVAGAGIPLEPDLDVVTDTLYGRTSDGMGAALRGVQRLPKATVLSVTVPGSARQQRYWHPERLLEAGRFTDAELEERFHQVFGRAVNRALTGDDAVSLSGGIDSPAVAGYAAPGYAERTGRRLGALSAVFPDLPAVDESAYIQLVAGRLDMELHTYRPQSRALDRMQQWAALLDGPVPTVSVPELDENYRLAARLGYRTLLTGELAEFVIDQRLHLLAHLIGHGRLRAAGRNVARQRARRIAWSTIARQLTLVAVPGRVANRWIDRGGVHSARRIPDWLDRGVVDQEPYRIDLMPSPRRRWIHQQLLAFPGPGITIEADELVADMHGVTVRRPFADVDVWELFLSIPAEQKFPTTSSKALVRRFLRGRVPDEILDRRDKTVFNDHVASHVDYAALRDLVGSPAVRLPGVRYERLAERLANQDLGVVDAFWVRDLAAAHAFLRTWEQS